MNAINGAISVSQFAYGFGSCGSDQPRRAIHPLPLFSINSEALGK